MKHVLPFLEEYYFLIMIGFGLVKVICTIIRTTKSCKTAVVGSCYILSSDFPLNKSYIAIATIPRTFKVVVPKSIFNTFSDKQYFSLLFTRISPTFQSQQDTSNEDQIER